MGVVAKVMHVTTAYNEETQSIQCIMENSGIHRSPQPTYASNVGKIFEKHYVGVN